jgi:hypothetical protein
MAVNGRMHRPGAWGDALSPILPNMLFNYAEACTLSYALCSSFTCEPLLRYKLGLFSAPLPPFLLKYRSSFTRKGENETQVGSIVRSFLAGEAGQSSFAFMASAWDLAASVCIYLHDYWWHVSHRFDFIVFLAAPIIPDTMLSDEPCIRSSLSDWASILAKLNAAVTVEDGSGDRHMFDMDTGEMDWQGSIFLCQVCFFQRRVETFQKALEQCPESERSEIYSLISSELNAMSTAWKLVVFIFDTLRNDDDPSESNDEREPPARVGFPARHLSFETFWLHSDARVPMQFVIFPFSSWATARKFELLLRESRHSYSEYMDSVLSSLYVINRAVISDWETPELGRFLKQEYFHTFALWRLTQTVDCFRPSIRTYASEHEIGAVVDRIADYVDHFALSRSKNKFWDPIYVSQLVQEGSVPDLSDKEAFALVLAMTSRDDSFVQCHASDFTKNSYPEFIYMFPFSRRSPFPSPSYRVNAWMALANDYDDDDNED